jgi:hypothetical protein
MQYFKYSDPLGFDKVRHWVFFMHPAREKGL